MKLNKTLERKMEEARQHMQHAEIEYDFEMGNILLQLTWGKNPNLKMTMEELEYMTETLVKEFDLTVTEF